MNQGGRVPAILGGPVPSLEKTTCPFPACHRPRPPRKGWEQTEDMGGKDAYGQ